MPPGVLRLFAIPITIAAGWVVAIPLGVFDFRSALDAPWFGLPQFSAWPGFSSIRFEDFLALLPVFLIVSIVVGIKASNEGAAIQQVSWRIPRAVDFRGVQGTLNVSGIGILLSGIAGTLPPLNYLPSSIALINFTSVAARRAGFVIGATLIAIALLPKIVAVLLTIPRPVTGVILMIVMGLLFVEGIRTVLQDGFQPAKSDHCRAGALHRYRIADTQHSRRITRGASGAWRSAIASSSASWAAVLMSLLLEITASRRRRFETELDISSLS